MDVRAVLDDGRHGERRQLHDASVRGAQCQELARASFELDRRKRIAAGAGRHLLAHAVAEIVADDRLHGVGKIREQHRVRELAAAAWAAVGLHRLQHDIVGVDVHGTELARIAEREAFRRAVFVVDGAVEGVLDEGARRR